MEEEENKEKGILNSMKEKTITEARLTNNEK